MPQGNLDNGNEPVADGLSSEKPPRLVVRKRAALGLMLTTDKSLTNIASEVGRSSRTLRRWRRDDPSFWSGGVSIGDTDHISDADAGAPLDIEALCARLTEASGVALSTLYRLMADPKVPGGVRCRAALGVLAATVRFNELVEVDSRLANLERLFEL